MVIGILFYPKQLKAEMGNGYSGCMMVDYPKQPWAEMGKESEEDGGFHPVESLRVLLRSNSTG